MIFNISDVLKIQEWNFLWYGLSWMKLWWMESVYLLLIKTSSKLLSCDPQTVEDPGCKLTSLRRWQETTLGNAHMEANTQGQGFNYLFVLLPKVHVRWLASGTYPLPAQFLPTVGDQSREQQLFFLLAFLIGAKWNVIKPDWASGPQWKTKEEGVTVKCFELF